LVVKVTQTQDSGAARDGEGVDDRPNPRPLPEKGRGTNLTPAPSL